MNKNKLIYEAPEAETFVIRFEGCLCVSGGAKLGVAGQAGATDSYNDYGEDDF